MMAGISCVASTATDALNKSNGVIFVTISVASLNSKILPTKKKNNWKKKDAGLPGQHGAYRHHHENYHKHRHFPNSLRISRRPSVSPGETFSLTQRNRHHHHHEH